LEEEAKKYEDEERHHAEEEQKEQLEAGSNSDIGTLLKKLVKRCKARTVGIQGGSECEVEGQ